MAGEKQGGKFEVGLAGAVVFGVLALTLVLFGTVGCGMFGRTATEEAPGSSDTRNQWTPESLAKMRMVLKGRIAHMIPDYDPAAMRARNWYLECMLKEVQRTLPRGPRELWESHDRAMRMATQVGEECASEFFRPFSTAAIWSATLQSDYELLCATEIGWENREFCSCLAKHAPGIFESPRAFAEVNAQPPDEWNASNRERMDRLFRQCGANIPVGH